MFDKEELKKIKAAQDLWEQDKNADFKKERRNEFLSESGLVVNRIYSPLDLESRGINYLEDIGYPGQFPYTRGESAIGYRGKLGGIEQYAGHPTPEASNILWKAQIANGSHRIAVAYDLPTQLGYDPDDPQAEGEVGRVGISMCSLRDWEVAFKDIDLRNIVIGQVLNAPSIIGLANHISLAKARGIETADIAGTIQNDILKEYQARGCYIFPMEPSLRLAIDVMRYCGQYMPLFRGIDFCTYHQAECGATPVNEAAIGLANCIAYFEAAQRTGVDVDTVAPTVRWLLACDHRLFFEHIAKIRAMRRIYSRLMKDRFGALKPESMAFRNYSGKRGLTLYREQYLNNIARSAIAGMAAMFAGSQSMGLRSYDEAFGIASEEALITSSRIQQIITHETGITDTIDPLAGSYFVESLTDEMETLITEQLNKIESLGGALMCTKNGYFHNIMTKDAYEWQKRVESSEVVIVGVNQFRSEKGIEKPTVVFRSDSNIEAKRIKDVRNLRDERDNHAVTKALDRIKAVALETGPQAPNMIDTVLFAVQSYCTVGEICKTLRGVWGEYQEFH